MRVIKAGGLAAIAAEMLNIEMGRYFFTPSGVNLTNDDPYPRFDISPERMGYISTNRGTIVLPLNTEIDQKELFATYKQLAESIPPELKKRVHIISKSYHQVHRSTIPVGKSNTSVYSEFIWSFKNLWKLSNTFDENIGISELTVDYFASILYDPKSITTFADQDTVYSFDKTNLVGNRYVSGLDLIVCNLPNPLEIEMSEHWSKVATHSKVMLVNVTPEKVFTCKIGDVKWTAPTDKCTRCRSDIFGEFYGLSYEIYKPVCAPFCTLCVHNGEPFDERLERRYSIICRFNNAREFTSVKKNDLLREFKQQIVQYDRFILIGSRYIGVYDIDKCIYSDMCREPEFEGRMICSLNNIQL